MQCILPATAPSHEDYSYTTLGLCHGCAILHILLRILLVRQSCLIHFSSDIFLLRRHLSYPSCLAFKPVYTLSPLRNTITTARHTHRTCGDPVAMATYADYPTQTMSSNNDDLPLYPYQDWNADPSYLPTSTYVDQPYLAATTFDSYASQPSFAPLPDYDLVGFQPLEQSKLHLAVRSPQYSPAQSASHSLDFQNPSVLSDSGASVPSTISSAMGSPAIQPEATEWNQFQQQVCPSIVQQADGAFAAAGFEFDTAMPVIEKHCVGQYQSVIIPRQLGS